MRRDEDADETPVFLSFAMNSSSQKIATLSKERSASASGNSEAELSAVVGQPLTMEIGEQVFVETSAVPLKRIQADEIMEIYSRRRALGTLQSGDGKDCLVNASGLALSGGGIRSATFCLGIVQVLVKKGLFHHFDYLSTVSGGGYLGAFLSTALGTTQEDASAKTSAKKTEKAAEKKATQLDALKRNL